MTRSRARATMRHAMEVSHAISRGLAPPGRCCAHQDCITVLSAYNPRETCYLHTDATPAPLRVRAVDRRPPKGGETQ